MPTLPLPMLIEWIDIFAPLKKSNLLMLIWIVLGITFLILALHKIHVMALIDTAQCLIDKETASEPDFFTHLAQLIYRILFENCDHEYR